MITNNNFVIPIPLQPDVVVLIIYKTMSHVGPNSLDLKYQRFMQSCCKDIGIKKRIWGHCTTPFINCDD